MAVYGFLGEGECSKKFLTETLDALRDKATLAEDDFWLILPYDPEGNSNALADIYDWVEENEVWARTFSPSEAEEEVAVEEFNIVKRGTVAQAIVKDLVKEGGELLVILHTMNPDEPDDRDEEVNKAIIAANQNGVTVRQINNGMIELDLTAEPEPEPEEEGPTVEDVRNLGEAADKGDTDAAEALSALGEEYGLDFEEEPYASMTWEDFAEEILKVDGEKANAEVEPAEPDKQPQTYDRKELEAMHLRQLRSLALSEGWGHPDQNFPHWFLVDHIASGTVPTEAELAGEHNLPKDRPGTAPAKRGRPRKTAETNGQADSDTYKMLAGVLRKLADLLDTHSEELSRT